MGEFRGTTVVAIQREGEVAMAGDGQVTHGDRIIKSGARKVRYLFGGKVLAGFAGATADALTLFERFEAKLKEHPKNILRAAVELAKDWRMDRMLRRLEAMLLVADPDHLLVVAGGGDVLEMEGGIAAIGSGSSYALAAAKVLLKHTELPASEIALEAIRTASEICVYTNQEIILETLRKEEPKA